MFTTGRKTFLAGNSQSGWTVILRWVTLHHCDRASCRQFKRKDWPDWLNHDGKQWQSRAFHSHWPGSRIRCSCSHRLNTNRSQLLWIEKALPEAKLGLPALKYIYLISTTHQVTPVTSCDIMKTWMGQERHALRDMPSTSFNQGPAPSPSNNLFKILAYPYSQILIRSERGLTF